MRKYVLLFFIIINLDSFSQEVALKYSNRISSDSIRSYLFTLASDSMEGRETGKPGQKKASYFLRSKYFSWGLHPGADSVLFGNNSALTAGKTYLQDHPINIRNNKGHNLCINGENFLFGKDFFYNNVNSDKTIVVNDCVVINVNTKIKKSVLKNAKKYSGKNIVLFDDDNNPDWFIKFISSNNVLPATIFVLTSDEKPSKLFSYRTITSQSLSCPVFFISETTAKVLLSPDEYKKQKDKNSSGDKITFKKIKCDLSVDVVRNINELRGQNVVAFIPGTDRKNETVVISSHYDHLGIKDSLIYFGADDNASGTSGVLELARVFEEAKKEGHGPRRNILFLNVTGEEKGLLGSAWYVAHPAFPIDSTIVDLNIDMIGRTDPFHDSTGVKNYVYIIGSDKMSTELHTINESQNTKGPNLELNYRYNSADDPNRYYKRSDHYNFVKKGIPVIFYFDGNHKDYHKPTDTPDKIDFDQLVNRAKLVFLTAWELANRNERIIVDKKSDLDK